MNLRSLLVHVADDARNTARITLAAGLARHFECHLIGLAPTGIVPLWSTTVPPVEALDRAMDELRLAAELRCRQFREQCARLGLHSCESVVDESEPAASLVRHGYCSDLVVIGQAEPGAAGYGRVREQVEDVVLRSARPTLVMPHCGHFEAPGERVLVAWDDRRESTRALGDAMPLLTRAKSVHVVACERPGDAELGTERLDALRSWLGWHGIDATVAREVTEIDFGSALLSRAADFGADLIVMGAYGHARWSERLLGGVTQTVLANMTVPVLMSH